LTYWEHFFCPFVFNQLLGAIFIFNIFMECPVSHLISVWVSCHNRPKPKSSILSLSGPLSSLGAWRRNSALRTPQADRLRLTEEGDLRVDTTGPHGTAYSVYQPTLPLSSKIRHGKSLQNVASRKMWSNARTTARPPTDGFPTAPLVGRRAA